MQNQGKNTHRINCIQIRECILTVTNTIKDLQVTGFSLLSYHKLVLLQTLCCVSVLKICKFINGQIG